jgi:ubiquinone biosynthesis protein
MVVLHLLATVVLALGRMAIVSFRGTGLVFTILWCELAASALPGRRENLKRTAARSFAHTLEALGSTYVKLGQILAMRADLVPPPYVQELAYLLDKVRPFATERARQIIEDDLGRPIASVFASFGEQPIASASFGQVYEARLASGEHVAVKVRRPGIERMVRIDLLILSMIAWALDISTVMLSVSVREFYKEFREYTEQELDYRIEARNVHRIYENAQDSEIERVPKVFWHVTSTRTLVLEFLQGIWVNDLIAAIEARDEETLQRWRDEGLDLEVITKRLLYVLLRQAFVHGTFHADPHAANIVILEGNVIGLVDFGIIGSLAGDYQRNMYQLFRSMSEGSASRAFAAIVKVLSPSSNVNLRMFKARYESNMQRWLNVAHDSRATIREKSAGRLVFSNLVLLREFGLHLPPAVARFYRSLLIVDAVVLRLRRDINMVAELGRAVRQVTMDRLYERLHPARYGPAALAYGALLLEIPNALSEIFDSRLLVDTLEAVRSLETGLQALGRAAARFIAATLRTAGYVFFAYGVVIRFFPELHLSVRWFERLGATGFVVIGAAAIFLSRTVRSRIG